jgi:hypothetical protein
MFASETPLVTACVPSAMPIAAWKRGSRVMPQVVLPPVAVNAVSVPREWPNSPARVTSAELPNQPGTADNTAETSRTRSTMLVGTGSRWHGGASPSLHGTGGDAPCALAKSIRTSSCWFAVWPGATTTNPALAICSSV